MILNNKTTNYTNTIPLNCIVIERKLKYEE